jgi:hypothetical protein
MTKYNLLITAMTREEAQPSWEKIVDIGFSDYDKLSTDQKVWFNIEPLTTGGIIDHYINHGAEHNRDTLDALEFLGFHDLAEQMRGVNKLFKNGQPPADIIERNEQWNSWCHHYETLLDNVDKNLWARCTDLENALMEHIKRTGID